MAGRSKTVFRKGDIVTHDVIGDLYIVVSSGAFYTQVVTNGDQPIDISFPTEDLIWVAFSD